MTDWTKKIIIVLFGTIHSSHWRSAWNGRAPTRSRSKKHILELTSQVQLERSRRSVACAHSLSICAKGRRLAINNKKPLHPIRDVLPCQFFDRVLFFILISWNIWFEPDVSPPGLCERSFFFSHHFFSAVALLSLWRCFRMAALDILVFQPAFFHPCGWPPHLFVHLNTNIS